MAQQNNIIILKFPSHSTHVLQPLDLNFFGPLKSILGQLIRDRVTANETLKLAKEDFAEILSQAWLRIGPKWLKKGFIMSGIHTPNGINKKAVKDEELIKVLPYDTDGNLFLQLTVEELKELQFPEQDPAMRFMTQQFIETLTIRPSAQQPKRKISKYNLF